MEADRRGADVIELGVPFSDPIGDGPVNQRSAERALRAGTSGIRVLETVARVREQVRAPIVLMGYYNPIHAFGLKAFARTAVEAGVDGVLVVDLPPEEAGDLAAEGGRGRARRDPHGRADLDAATTAPHRPAQRRASSTSRRVSA